MDKRNYSGHRGHGTHLNKVEGWGGRSRKQENKQYKPPQWQEEMKFSPYGQGSGKILAIFVIVKDSIIRTN